MNYNIIAQLLENGISEEEILSSITKSLPSIAKKASKLFSGGWRAKDVLDYFSRDKDVQKTLRKGVKPTTPGEIAAMRLRDSYNNIAPSEKEQSIEELKSFTKQAAPFALGAMGSLASPMAQNALQRAFPQVSGLLQNAMGNGNQQLKGIQKIESNIQQPQINPLETPVNADNIAQQAGLQQPEVKSIDVGELLNKRGLLKHVESMAKDKRDPKEIAAILYSKYPNEMKDFQTEAGKPMEDAIADFVGQKSQIEPEITPEMQQNLQKVTPTQPEIQKIEPEIDLTGMGKGITDNLYNRLFESLKKGSTKFAGIEDPLLKKAKPFFDKGEIKSPEDLRDFANKKEEPKKIEKKSIVSSSQGIGEVKEIRNGKVLVEIDGKLHKIDEEDLESPEFSDDEIANAYDNIMNKIPEEHKSGFISWAGYDEDRNVLGFIPRGGKYEELHNITPEEANIIKEGKGIARTTGETREGLWIAGEDTRGGLISQIIHDRKKKHKAEEEKQGKFQFELPKKEKEDKGMKPIFDEMAFAREKSRERERKIKLEEKRKTKEEKERLKKEQDEIKRKKRKKQT